MDIIDKLFPLLSVLLGAVLSFGSVYLCENRKRKLEAENLLNSLKAEIKTLLKLIYVRDYLSFLVECINHAPTKHDLKSCSPFSVILPRNEIYNIIFKNNANKIGLIDCENSSNIVEFHGIIEAILQDFLPNSVFNQNGGLYKEILVEDIKLLAKAIILGQKIIGEDFFDNEHLEKHINFSVN